MGSSLDVLLIHEGKPYASDNRTYLLPMGLLAIADWLVQHGHRAEVLHLPVERAADPAFDLPATIRDAGAALVCMDLHWHQQSRTVIDQARHTKAQCPEVPIVLGGYTASAFDLEILERFEFIDFVIRGDGEIPVLQLVEALAAEQDRPGTASFERVANLSYRTDGTPRRSDAHHVNTAEDLGRFRFAPFELLRHQQLYNQGGIMEGDIRLDASRLPGIFYCNCGRGCPYNCTFCGGARDAQRTMGGRQRIAYRPAEAMVTDLARIGEFNLDAWYNTFDPSPNHSYFLDLFDRIRAEGVQTSLIHECLHLPSPEFLESFAKTFGPRRRLDFVLLTASDELRRRNKDNYFSRDDMLQCIERAEDLGIPCDVCLLTGMPFEEEQHLVESIELAAELGRRFEQVNVNSEMLAIEPLAPMNCDPEAFGIQSHARTFLDYYQGHGEAHFYGYVPGRVTAARAQQAAREQEAACRDARRAAAPQAGSVASAPAQGEPDREAPEPPAPAEIERRSAPDERPRPPEPDEPPRPAEPEVPAVPQGRSGSSGRAGPREPSEPARLGEAAGSRPLDALCRGILRSFAALDGPARERYRVDRWQPSRPPQPVRHADAAAMRLTFTNAGDTVELDAFLRTGAIRQPLAQGARLVFCPPLGPTLAARASQDPEALRHIGQTLADLDREPS